MSQFLEVGKKWRADSVDITDGTNEDYRWRLKRRLMNRLEAGLCDQQMQRDRDAVVIYYGWD